MFIVWFIYNTVLTNNPKQQMYWQKKKNQTSRSSG